MLASQAQSDEQIQAYIEKMRKYAILEMYRTGVPASVTIAQGIVETAAGTSDLYLRSYNNFGIKCKSNWTGRYTQHDDDAKGECFRVYDNDSLSFVDHSNFLKGSSRYNFLFQLEPNDYKAWAIGLKKAGYATNPSYPILLIKHIETLGLSQYDNVPKDEIQNHNTYSKPAIVNTNTQIQNNEAGTSINANAAASGNNPSTATPVTSTTPATSIDNLDLNNLQVVHWDTKNITDATPGYTHSAGPVTTKTYKGKHGISYGKKGYKANYSSKKKLAYKKAPAKLGSKKAVVAKANYGKKSTAKKPIAAAKKKPSGSIKTKH